MKIEDFEEFGLRNAIRNFCMSKLRNIQNERSSRLNIKLNHGYYLMDFATEVFDTIIFYILDLDCLYEPDRYYIKAMLRCDFNLSESTVECVEQELFMVVPGIWTEPFIELSEMHSPDESDSFVFNTTGAHLQCEYKFQLDAFKSESINVKCVKVLGRNPATIDF